MGTLMCLRLFRSPSGESSSERVGCVISYNGV